MSDGDWGADWREKVLAHFAAWLNELSCPQEAISAGEEFSGLKRQGEEVPDLVTFFNELAVLKQEIRQQTRAASALSAKTENILEITREDFRKQTHNLEDTVAAIKAQIPQARQDGEDKILGEFIKIRDELCHSIALREQVVIKKDRFIRRKQPRQNEALQSTRLLLQKIDDAFRRLNVLTCCEIGQVFDATCMRVVSLSAGTGSRQGCVTGILRQGYKKEGRLLQVAEVRVEKENNENE